LKLKKFIGFSDSLLPHEVLLLESSAHFQDTDRVSIFNTIKDNTLSKETKKQFDSSIDKRKYSHLMKWIEARLDDHCTDTYYKRLNDFDNKIKTDTLSSEEEKELLKLIKNYKRHHFHFIRFYEVIKNYLNFLLVRVRLNDYELINRFVHNYHDDYIRSKDISNRMTQATSEIVTDYHSNRLSQNSLKWSPWLKRLFDDESIDGFNHYQVLILLSYLALLKSDLLQQTLEYYDKLENRLIDGSYYSRKLLLNFYGNRQLILMKLHKYDDALYYGHLSIGKQGHDYIMYLNNYCFNLMKLGRPKEALKLLKDALPFVRQMTNKYNKSLFISSMVKCYNENGEFRKARQYAENQLTQFEVDILEHNWNKFFRTYLETLLNIGDYRHAKKIIKRYGLLEKENSELKVYTGYPYFKWIIALVDFKEGNTSGVQFRKLFLREKDRLALSYNGKPSKSIMLLIENALKV
jgi:tetratricopeptide (TPR) repeat protein